MTIMCLAALLISVCNGCMRPDVRSDSPKVTEVKSVTDEPVAPIAEKSSNGFNIQDEGSYYLISLPDNTLNQVESCSLSILGHGDNGYLLLIYDREEKILKNGTIHVSKDQPILTMLKTDMEQSILIPDVKEELTENGTLKWTPDWIQYVPRNSFFECGLLNATVFEDEANSATLAYKTNTESTTVKDSTTEATTSSVAGDVNRGDRDRDSSSTKSSGGRGGSSSSLNKVTSDTEVSDNINVNDEDENGGNNGNGTRERDGSSLIDNNDNTGVNNNNGSGSSTFENENGSNSNDDSSRDNTFNDHSGSYNNGSGSSSYNTSSSDVNVNTSTSNSSSSNGSQKLPQSGSPVDTQTVFGFGLLLMLAGVFTLKKKAVK